MKQNPESEIISYLSRPENIRTTLEIGSRFESIKNSLYEKFWSGLQQSLQKTLENSKLATIFSPSYEYNNTNEECYIKWKCLGLNTRIHTGTQKTFLLYTVQQQYDEDDGSFSIWYGVGWHTEKKLQKQSNWKELFKTLWDKPYISSLIYNLSKLGYEQEIHNVPGFKVSSKCRYESEIDLLEKSVTDFNVISDEICSEVVELIKNTYDLVIKANLELGKEK
jgi:hypothetical protein